MSCNFFDMLRDTIFVSFLFLESRILSDFGFITFTSPNVSIQITTDKVRNFEFQRQAVTFFQAADIPKTVKHCKWKRYCKDYVRKFYTKHESFVEAVLVPDFTKTEGAP